jgi:hypothetical protein
MHVLRADPKTDVPFASTRTRTVLPRQARCLRVTAREWPAGCQGGGLDVTGIRASTAPPRWSHVLLPVNNRRREEGLDLAFVVLARWRPLRSR